MNLFRRWGESEWPPSVGQFSRGRCIRRREAGRARVAGSSVAPPWLKPCVDAWVGSGGGCQGARGDPAPG